MVGVELAVGYLFGWIVRKGQRIGRDVDRQIDAALDAGVDRVGGQLHALVAGKLGNDPAWERLNREADEGNIAASARTRQRVMLALEDVIESDPEFSRDFQKLVEQLSKTSAGNFPHSTVAVVGGQLNVQASDGSVAASVLNGDIHLQNPR